MAKPVHPKSFLIAETQASFEGMQSALESLGVTGWGTDAETSADLLTEFAGKSCYMSFDTTLNQNLTKTGTRNNHDYIQQGIIANSHGCYDPETEVLTSEGWKFFGDVTSSDLLATRTAEGVVEYHRPINLIAAPYKGRMYRVKARGVDLLVTDNHNMLVCKTTTREGRKRKDFSLIQARELGHVSHAYTKTASWEGGDKTLRPDLLALLGFSIGDACYRKGVLYFSLIRERKVTYLRALCESLGWELSPSKTANKYQVRVDAQYHTLFSGVYAENGDKQVPPGVIMGSDANGLRGLFLGLMESDGHYGATGDCFDTTSQRLVGQMQQICLHIGLAANICYTYSKEDGRRATSFGDKPLTRLTIVGRELAPEVNKFSGAVGRTSWVEDWEGEVYCAEVPNNTLYVRRNGIPVWCGNSVLEHATVTFFITNVSRVVTHEIIRHRAGTAFSQTSGRYVRTDEVGMYLPRDIACNPAAVQTWKRAIRQMEDNARELAEVTGISDKPFSIKKKLTSAFRRIIGNGQANHIVVTANHRAWRHMIEMRTDPHAEEEIRVVFADISRQLRERFATIYADAIVTVEDGIEVTTFKHSKV